MEMNHLRAEAELLGEIVEHAVERSGCRTERDLPEPLLSGGCGLFTS